MNCNDALPLLEAHADGELDLVRQVELEAHLSGCAHCARVAASIGARREALRGALPRFSAPASLRAQILAAVRDKDPAGKPVRGHRAPVLSFWSLGGIAAALVLALLGGYTWGAAHERASRLFDEAVASHVRSLQAGHLMDVVSTDQHTVKPWFAGKVDFAPPVADLADSGFPLIGGRLDEISGRPAAALVFRRRQHAINLFVWPVGEAALSERHAMQKGYATLSWSQSGMNFLAVSEIPAGDLDQFAAEYRRRVSPQAP